MESHGSRWRLAVGEQLAPVYRGDPRVRAVIVGGSTARGLADRYSDLELGVFWSELPDEAERAAAIRATGGDLHRLYPPEDGILEDAFFIGRDDQQRPKSGLLVEVNHVRAANLEGLVAGLDREPAGEPGELNLLSAVVDGVALAGAEWIGPLARSAERYPDPLRHAVIRRYGSIEFLWRWEMMVARGSAGGPLRELLWAIQSRLLQGLLALNRRYPIAAKFLPELVARCPEAPAELAGRLAALQTAAPERAVADLTALVRETYDLIELRVPALAADVATWREWFAYRRPFWDDRPPNFPR